MSKSLLDPTFVYVNANKTDIKKTFARIRREQRKAEELAAAEALAKVQPIRKAAK